MLIHCPVKIPRGPGLQPSSQPPLGPGAGWVSSVICSESFRLLSFLFLHLRCERFSLMPLPLPQAPRSAPGLRQILFGFFVASWTWDAFMECTP